MQTCIKLTKSKFLQRLPSPIKDKIFLLQRKLIICQQMSRPWQFRVDRVIWCVSEILCLAQWKPEPYNWWVWNVRWACNKRPVAKSTCLASIPYNDGKRVSESSGTKAAVFVVVVAIKVAHMRITNHTASQLSVPMLTWPLMHAWICISSWESEITYDYNPMIQSN